MAGPLLAPAALLGKIITSIGKKVVQNKIKKPKVITENIIKKHADKSVVNQYNKLNRYQKDEIIKSSNVGFKGKSKTLDKTSQRMSKIEKQLSSAQKFVKKYTNR